MRKGVEGRLVLAGGGFEKSGKVKVGAIFGGGHDRFGKRKTGGGWEVLGGKTIWGGLLRSGIHKKRQLTLHWKKSSNWWKAIIIQLDYELDCEESINKVQIITSKLTIRFWKNLIAISTSKMSSSEDNRTIINT